MRIGLIVASVVVGCVAVGGAGKYISAYNYGNAIEQRLKAEKENNENILAQYGQKISEMGLVASEYSDQLKEVVTAALEGRYGDDGSQAVFQWIQEQNPTIDSAVYTTIQRAMEAGRTEFQVAQTRLIDTKRQYETELGSFISGTFLGAAGYPKVDLDEFSIVTTARANKAFETGVEDGPVNPFSK